MTLIDIVNNLFTSAIAEPNIHTTLSNDIYQLNTMGDVEFSAFCITQDRHTSDEDVDTYRFYVFYVDRLNEDRSNQLEIQSTGCILLKNIFNRFNSIDFDTQIDWRYEVTPFNERFTSECAGVYALINITTPSIGICEI